MILSILTSLRGGGSPTPPPPPSDGLVYNRSQEAFETAFSYTPNPTVLNFPSDGSVQFASTVSKQTPLLLKKNEQIFYHQYEYWRIELKAKISMWRIAEGGFFVGAVSSASGPFGFRVGGDAAEVNKISLQAQIGTPRLGDPVAGPSFSPGDELTFIIERSGKAMSIRCGDAVCSFAAGFLPYSDYTLPAVTAMFGIYFFQGGINLTEFTVTIPYTGISCAFIGDSITQGQSATAYENAYAQKLKAIFPDGQVFAGRSNKTADVVALLPALSYLRPAKATILIGVNDMLNSIPMETIQANYAAILSGLEALGIEPILISVLPRGNSAVTLNSWLRTSYPQLTYIDMWEVMRVPDTTSMNPNYSADGVHPNDLGMQVMYDTFANQYP